MKTVWWPQVGINSNSWFVLYFNRNGTLQNLGQDLLTIQYDNTSINGLDSCHLQNVGWVCRKNRQFMRKAYQYEKSSKEKYFIVP